jgi:hypothetical protein
MEGVTVIYILGAMYMWMGVHRLRGGVKAIYYMGGGEGVTHIHREGYVQCTYGGEYIDVGMFKKTKR